MRMHVVQVPNLHHCREDPFEVQEEPGQQGAGWEPAPRKKNIVLFPPSSGSFPLHRLPSIDDEGFQIVKRHLAILSLYY